MPDFRVDDGFGNHPKTVGLSLEAIGLWTLAGAWSMRYLTDGHVPAEVMTPETVAADMGAATGPGQANGPCAPPDRAPNLHWHVRCLDCHAAGMFYHEAEAHEWAEAHHCPPKDDTE